MMGKRRGGKRQRGGERSRKDGKKKMEKQKRAGNDWKEEEKHSKPGGNVFVFWFIFKYFSASFWVNFLPEKGKERRHNIL